MTHTESLARQLVDAAERETTNGPRAVVAAVLDALGDEHRAGLMPYNPGPYIHLLAEMVREGS
jgi:hypothetical protein